MAGIDPETHRVLVWLGKQAPAVRAADLVQMIAGESTHSSPAQVLG